jgi:hypothetical protein
MQTFSKKGAHDQMAQFTSCMAEAPEHIIVVSDSLMICISTTTSMNLVNDRVQERRLQHQVDHKQIRTPYDLQSRTSSPSLRRTRPGLPGVFLYISHQARVRTTRTSQRDYFGTHAPTTSRLPYSVLGAASVQSSSSGLDGGKADPVVWHLRRTFRLLGLDGGGLTVQTLLPTTRTRHA